MHEKQLSQSQTSSLSAFELEERKKLVSKAAAAASTHLSASNLGSISVHNPSHYQAAAMASHQTSFGLIDKGLTLHERERLQKMEQIFLSQKSVSQKGGGGAQHGHHYNYHHYHAQSSHAQSNVLAGLYRVFFKMDSQAQTLPSSVIASLKSGTVADYQTGGS